MKVKIHFCNFETSEILEHHTEKLLDQISPDLRKNIISVRIWFKTHNSFLKRGQNRHSIKIEAQTRDFGRVFTQEIAPDLYHATTVAINELEAMMRKKKNQQQSPNKKLLWLRKRFAT